MSKARKNSIDVQGSAIAVVSNDTGDFISLTDMAKKFGDDVRIYNWMHNRNTLEFIGIWEQIHNPAFKGLEFETFRKAQASAVYASEADLLNVALFGQTSKQWRDANPNAEGNLRAHAPLEKLVVLPNSLLSQFASCLSPPHPYLPSHECSKRLSAWRKPASPAPPAR